MELAILLLIIYVPFFLWMYAQGVEDWRKSEAERKKDGF
jgi:hypothetical protein